MCETRARVGRREFLRVLGAGAAAMALPRLAFGAPTAAGRPNVLFIGIDDLNDWTGCLGGHPDARTPNLDRLVARGVLFSNAHCPAPACNPSRAALMTGVRPSTSGVYRNSEPWRASPVLKDAVTLPQHFRSAGYRPIGSGKIYHGAFPDPASWDEYWPSQQRSRPADPLPPRINLNGLGLEHFDWGPLEVDDEQMSDAQVARWVSSQLGRTHEKPLFLACGFYRPHLPWYVPRKYFERFPLEKVTLPKVKKDDLDDVPPVAKKFANHLGDHSAVTRHNQWRQGVQAYLASIAFMDAQLGKVIDALDEGPLAKNTIVVVWSDHGWHLGEKLHWRKFTLWEEATHNVLGFVAPGVTQAGGVCTRPVNLLDIYPTLVDLCGLSAATGQEGVSLRSLLKNPQAPWDRPTLTTYTRGCHSIRSERWRYTRYVDGTEELYDHDTDPLEWTNLAERPEQDAVKKDLARWLPKTDAPSVPKTLPRKD